jgi:DNA-binding winged helix-turn-helix (wHTH) protein
MAARESTVFRFGDYLLQPAARELRHGQRRLALAPKVLDALLWLFENRERAVGRDELSAAVWGKADVTDTQLDQLIRNLRRAVGDSGSSQEVIRTVPRYGYRWIAAVEPLAMQADGSLPTMPATNTDESAPRNAAVARAARNARWRPAALAFGAAALLAAASGVLWHAWRTTPAAQSALIASPSEPASASLVAVLPITMDATTDSQWAWLRLGLMDLLAARLREGGANVVPTHNLVALLGARGEVPPTPVQVREATGARIVIAPSILRSGDGWRLQLDLSGMEGAAREVEVHAGEPAAAARQAADRVLVMLGRSPVAGRTGEERHGEEETALRINAAVASKRFDIARQLLDEVPASLQTAPRVRFMDAYVLLQEGKAVQAQAELEALADAPPEAGVDADIRVDALEGTGTVLTRLGLHAEALRRFDAAAALARTSRQPMAYGSVMHSRAALNGMLGRWPAADSDFAQARIAMEMVGDSLGLAALEASEAGMLTTRRRYAEAAALQARAIERLERFPPGESLLAAYGNTIFMELALLDTPAALATAARAEDTIGRMRPSPAPDSTLALHVARALIAAGRLGEADRSLRAISTGLDPAKSPDLYSTMLIQRAQLALENADPGAAAGLAAQAEDLRAMPALAAPHFARGRAAAALLRVNALQAEGRIEDARAAVVRFAHWAGNSGDPSVVMRLALARALQGAREESAEAADSRFDAALEAASNAAPADLAVVATAYGRHLIDAGQLEKATRVVGRVAQWSDRDFGCALLQVRLYHALGQPGAWQRALAAARRLAGERAIPPGLNAAPADADERARRALRDRPAISETTHRGS